MNPDFEEKQGLHLPAPTHTPQPAGVSPHAPAPMAPNSPPLAQDDNVDAYTVQAVQQAKRTVRQLNDDPYAQSNALARLKVEFMRHEFHKEIKLEDQPK